MRNIALISAALAATLSLPAQANEVTRHRAVKATAADFATPEGLARLERRLRSAARVVCRDHHPRSHPPTEVEQRCYRRAMLNTRARMAELREEYGTRKGG